MKTIKIALITACIMSIFGVIWHVLIILGLNQILGAILAITYDQPSRDFVAGQHNTNILLMSFDAVWDFLMAILLIFAIRRLGKLN